ncbi:hypothetical protein T4E_9905, partial [Trichinella pseudospiralis]
LGAIGCLRSAEQLQRILFYNPPTHTLFQYCTITLPTRWRLTSIYMRVFISLHTYQLYLKECRSEEIKN